MSAEPAFSTGEIGVPAPAKVNLRLCILAREETGYHQLETLFCALDLADYLVVRRGGEGIRLEVEGAELGPPEENLVHRAARLFFDAAGIAPAATFRLRKEVPHGAGLGGGSSDAAAALRALNTLFGAPLDRNSLLRLGASLGSDVPFFLCGSPLALAWGRGERLLPLTALPAAPILVVAPPFGIPTPEAYRALARFRAESAAATAPSILRPEALGSWQALAALAQNDFEAPTFLRFPELGRIRDTLAEAGALIALLSGSGSALFGVFRDAATRDAAAATLSTRFDGLRLITTTSAGPGTGGPERG